MQEVAVRFASLSSDSFHLIEFSRLLKTDSSTLLERSRNLQQKAKEQKIAAAFQIRNVRKKSGGQI